MRRTVALCLCVGVFALFAALSSMFGLTPAIAPLLSPFEGFWRQAEPLQVENQVPTIIDVGGLQAEASVWMDSASVPHVEAASEADMYRAQGYVTAALRLWQMDFVARAAAGRLAEIVGDQALGYDRYQRRIGMVYAAEQALQFMQADARTRTALEAFAAGANAYITQLQPRQYPLEYKILGYAPELWTPLKTCLLLKYMAYDLTGRTDEAGMSRALRRLGVDTLASLWPLQPDPRVPIVPAASMPPFTPLQLPMPDTTGQGWAAQGLEREPDPANGSNNWAVAAGRTLARKALLANDPHLGLTLPSIWLQMQLACPTQSVVGVTIPGAPGVIIGHNASIAWGVTNTGADVLDLYRIRFRDAACKEYLFDGKWTAAKLRVEQIRTRAGDVYLDTVRYTVHGPVAYLPGQTPKDDNVPAGLAVCWTAHQPSNEVGCYMGLNRATTYKAFASAVALNSCPAQNFAYADTTGRVAIHVAGRFPLKWQGQGRFVQDGGKSSTLWHGAIPTMQNPHALSPVEGFVQSANQMPAWPGYPYYLDYSFASPGRALRIHERLSSKLFATPADMRALQTDNLSLPAQNLMAITLPMLEANKAGLTLPELEGLAMLHEWNCRADSDQIAPSLYRAFSAALADTVWDELRGLPRPADERLQNLLAHQPASPWLDVAGTQYHEQAKDVVLAAYRAAFANLSRTYGAAGNAWRWGRVKHLHISHLGRIPGLGIPFLSTSGGLGSVNASKTDHGPSWRMVVELDKAGPHAWGIFPGGQSGNPGSPFYDNMVQAWRLGNLRPLRYYPYGTHLRPGLMELWVLR